MQKIKLKDVCDFFHKFLRNDIYFAWIDLFEYVRSWCVNKLLSPMTISTINNKYYYLPLEQY